MLAGVKLAASRSVYYYVGLSGYRLQHSKFLCFTSTPYGRNVRVTYSSVSKHGCEIEHYFGTLLRPYMMH